MRTSRSPATRFWRGQGRTFRSHCRGRRGAGQTSRFTEEGAGILDDPFLPGQHFTNPFGNYRGGFNLTWQLDIYRQLRNARDAAAQRYVVASERRNYFVTRLVAEIAENYYRLMALDKRLENLDQIIALQERSLEIAKARMEVARSTELVSCVSWPRFKEPEPKADRQSGHHPGREPDQLPRQSLPSACRTVVCGILRSEDSRTERGSALAATSEPTRYPPSRARPGGYRARREGRPGQLLSSVGDQRRRWP